MSSRPLLLPTELSEVLVDQLEMVGKPFLEEGSACTCRSCGTSCPPAYLHLQIEAYLHPSDHHNPGRAAREHVKLRGRFVCFGCRLAVQDLSVSVVSIHQAGVAFASKEEQLFDLPISNDALNASSGRFQVRFLPLRDAQLDYRPQVRPYPPDTWHHLLPFEFEVCVEMENVTVEKESEVLKRRREKAAAAGKSQMKPFEAKRTVTWAQDPFQPVYARQATGQKNPKGPGTVLKWS